jgi:GNAT superfamily N-acetyltransferase
MIRGAQPEDAPALSDLAFRSKAYWGYSNEFMDACGDELSIAADDLARQPTYVLERDGVPIGFYSLVPLGSGRVELGHLFVAPDEIGRGHGRRLLAHAAAEARRRGWDVLVIQGDPHAIPFYERCGAVRVGASASASIPGRSLPLFELVLSE